MADERKWIALRRIKVQLLDEGGRPLFSGEGDEKVRQEEWREPGEEVPEASAWKNLRAFVNMGHVGLEGDPETVRILSARRSPDTLAQREKAGAAIDAQRRAGGRGKQKPGPKPGAKRKAAAKKAAAAKPAPEVEEKEAGDQTVIPGAGTSASSEGVEATGEPAASGPSSASAE